MKMIRRNVLTTVLLLAAVSVASFAQGPLHKRVNYTIDAPYTLRMGDRMLPAGNYILYQFNLNNPNLFALYQGDMTREPVALIHTVRIDFQGSGYPDETEILLTTDEKGIGRGDVVELRGWTIPGTDGYEVIGVVTNRKQILALMQ
jgi:hypothetical protein